MTNLPRGTLIAGRYRVERVLGQGGMGCVLLARHIELGENVAVKVLRADQAPTREAVERLRREARAVARIRGENVARVMDSGVSEGHGPFIVMELVEGKSLAATLAEEGPLAVERAVDYALQACAALAEAHALGLVHRDVKPSNMLVTRGPDGSELLKVVDFGIAKADALANSTLTENGSLLGSPRYMSPEQAREASGVDARTDVWSLGVVLYELVTGHVPFEAYTAAGVLSRILTDAPTPMSDHGVVVPDDLERAIARMLSKDAEERFSSMTEVALALAPLGGSDAAARAARVKRIAEAKREPSADAPAIADEAPARPKDETITAASLTHGSASDAPLPVAPQPSRRWRAIWTVAAGIAVVAASALLLTSRRFGREGPSPSVAANPTAVASAQPTLHAEPVTTMAEPSAAPSATTSLLDAASLSPAPAASVTGVASAEPSAKQGPQRKVARGPGAAPTKLEGLDVDFGPRK